MEGREGNGMKGEREREGWHNLLTRGCPEQEEHEAANQLSPQTLRRMTDAVLPLLDCASSGVGGHAWMSALQARHSAVGQTAEGQPSSGVRVDAGVVMQTGARARRRRTAMATVDCTSLAHQTTAVLVTRRA